MKRREALTAIATLATVPLAAWRPSPPAFVITMEYRESGSRDGWRELLPTGIKHYTIDGREVSPATFRRAIDDALPLYDDGFERALMRDLRDETNGWPLWRLK